MQHQAWLARDGRFETAEVIGKIAEVAEVAEVAEIGKASFGVDRCGRTMPGGDLVIALAAGWLDRGNVPRMSRRASPPCTTARPNTRPAMRAAADRLLARLRCAIGTASVSQGRNGANTAR
jgi:hypothetical protein